MPNNAIAGLTTDERRFIEDVSRVLTPWGVPQTAARLYGRLLLSPELVSLDRLTTDLEISKSSASVAARQLEMYRLVRRHGVRGSRRVLYDVSDGYEGILAEQDRMLGLLAELLHARARASASRATRDRLKEMSEFYQVTRDALESVRLRWQRRRKP